MVFVKSKNRFISTLKDNSPAFPNRKSIRLPAFNYALAGAYFITICTHNRQCIFGDVVNGEIVLNLCGRIVEEEWKRSAVIRKEVTLDHFVIMPNHIHGIVLLLPEDKLMPDIERERATGRSPLQDQTNKILQGPRPQSIASLIAGFKSASTTRMNEADRTPGRQLWQRNYFEHVIRNEFDMFSIRQYIDENPLQWTEDRENSNHL